MPPAVPLLDASRFSWDLPADRIALHPPAHRTDARLCVVDVRAGTVDHRRIPDLEDELPPGTLLVLNHTRVILARLAARRPTGGAVEILCVDPVEPSPDPAITLRAGSPVRWRCLLSGRRIRAGDALALVSDPSVSITVDSREGAEATLRFSWPGPRDFAEVLERAGETPLPPYLKRDPEKEDRERYQAVWARDDGSVAAPTASLHFTPELLSELGRRGVATAPVTLHVGAGTFRPIQVPTVNEHAMHAERLHVPRATVVALVERHRSGQPVVAVGTTALRTLESLRWFGARLAAGESAHELDVDQWDAWRVESPASVVDSLEAVLAWMDARGIDHVAGQTRLMIAPGAPLDAAHGLLTNFHQPGSTLLVLVAAFGGEPLWRRVYDSCLVEGYRFLSYGDASLWWRRR